MRFKAPPHTSDAALSVGPVQVIDGFLTLPEGASTTDIAGLQANGFVLAPETVAAPEPEVAPAPKVAASEAPAAATTGSPDKA